MSKKLPVAVTVILVIVAIAVTAVVTVFVYLSQYDNLLSDLPKRAEQYNKLSEVDELVRQEYYGTIDYESLDRSLVQGYLAGLDENSYYIPADYFDTFSEILKGNSPGIGITASYDKSSDNLKISSVVSESPAEQSGIISGGYVLSVDGKDVTQENSEELIDLLVGTYDKRIRIVYSSDLSDSEELQLSSGFLKKSVSYSINDSTGYVRISAFYENTAELFSDAIDYFVEGSVDGIIIDLRNTEGSDFDVAADIIDMIVPVGSDGTGAIYTAKNSEGVTVKQRSSDVAALNIPLAVLINTRTQGAAELIACDLKDYSKAVVFGEKSYGNGSYQEIFRLQDGSAVLLTVAEIYPYVSESFNGKGISPDVEIITNESFKNLIGVTDLNEDEQYIQAYNYLNLKK